MLLIEHKHFITTSVGVLEKLEIST